MLPHNREQVMCLSDGDVRTSLYGGVEKKVTLRFVPYFGTPEEPNCDDPLYDLFWIGSDGFSYDSFGVAHHGFQDPTPDYQSFIHLIG